MTTPSTPAPEVINLDHEASEFLVKFFDVPQLSEPQYHQFRQRFIDHWKILTSRIISAEREKQGEVYKFWEPCEGCKEGHSSFWKTVIESRQWQAWGKKISENAHAAHEREKISKDHDEAWKDADVWDWDECTECGFISQNHFQSFLNFVRSTKEEGGRK